MDREKIFWKKLIIDDVTGVVCDTELDANATSCKRNLFKFPISSNRDSTDEDFEPRLKTSQVLKSEKQKADDSVSGERGEDKIFLHRPAGSVLDDNPTRLVSALRGSDNINGRGGGGSCRVERSSSGFQLFSWNGRRRSNRKGHAYQLRRSRYGLCVISRRKKVRNNKGLKNWDRGGGGGSDGRWALFSENAMCLLSRYFVNNECSLINYKSNRLSPRSFGIGQFGIADLETRVNNNNNNNNNNDDDEKLSPSSYHDLKNKSTYNKKQRRIGIVENQFSKEISIFRSVRKLIKNFSSLLEDKKKVRVEGHGTEERGDMNSRVFSSRDKLTEMIADTDLTEGENNPGKEDIFKGIPMARTNNKSPNSDEGIEPDAERKRDSVARCWSLDSAIPSDDDSCQNVINQKDERVRVTRCCSSDSAVLSDDDQNKVWGSPIANYGPECESSDGQPRYWRTPSVVVSDFSEYSYLEEKFERNNIEDKFEGNVSPSQTSSCSCFDCDEIRQSTENSLSLDFHLLQICRHRRHSDSCCLCVGSKNSITQRRNSCLASPGPYYPKLMRSEGSSPNSEISESNSEERETKGQGEFLDIPMCRKISDCSTNSSLSGDDCEITELQPIQRPKTSGWRKLRNIVQWTPFFQTYKKQRYPWVQLAGHQGNFRAGPTPGTILKKLCPQEEACFRLLMRDVLRPYVPEFKGVLDVRENENGLEQDADLEAADSKDRDGGLNARKSVMASYLQLQDLLGDFEQPCVMDCKVGVRTYLESELAKAKERPKLRKDMYEKMVQVDPSAPTAEERRVQGVTKPRYMVWRETISSTATLGFRVEGIKRAQGGSTKDFKTTRTLEQVTEALKRFTEGYPHAVPKYLQRLKAIRATLKASTFFATHEVVGSSLLFVHDATDAGIWMIDFAKTLPLPPHLKHIRHDAEWQVGNHEDGYLIGVNNLIDIFQDIRDSEP